MTDMLPFQRAFADLTSRNRIHAGVRPVYGWEALGYDADRNELEVRLTFLAGHSHCCHEPDCHVALSRREDWAHLRTLLAKHGATVSMQPMCVRLACVVEQGAEARVHRDFGLPAAGERQVYADAILREPS